MERLQSTKTIEEYKEISKKANTIKVNSIDESIAQ